MKKTLERLRQQKATAVDRMAALNALAKNENRELTPVEKTEYEARKTEAEALSSSITALEGEVAQLDAANAGETERLERERIGGIDQVCASFLASGVIDNAFVARLKADRQTTVAKAKEAIIDHMAASSAQNPIHGQHAAASVSVDAREKLREGLEAAIMFRTDPSNKEYAQKSAEFRGLTLVDMGRECLHVCGVKTRNMSREEIARVALQGVYGAAEHFAGMATTSDFPNILANVANKSLRKAYEAAPRSFTAFCNQVSAADFKPVNRVQLSEIAALHKVNEKGEFHRTYLSDSKESYSLATYGDIVSISRKVVVNDDLQSLTRVPAGLGIAAATLESDTVWAVITANGNLSDGVALFHATHKNLNTTNALAVAGLGVARKALRKQTGPKGTLLNLMPKFVIVPAALETALDQILYPTNIAVSALSAGVAPFMTSLVKVVEPRLDAVASVGDTNWYVAADPSMIDTIEYCYLEGQQGVYIESRQGFDIDGVEIKARLDFAAAAIDFRGLQKNSA